MYDTTNCTDGWSNARTMRQIFGLPAFWKLENQLSEKETPLPNCIVHEKPAETYDHEGGTNALAIGEKGSGKSTLALWLAIRLMEANDEAVIWRGSPSRSEWLPLKQWTKLMLPASAAVEADWQPEDIREGSGGEPADLESEVDEVVYYDGLRDLLDQLEPHQFHVVYPDPGFRGCEQIMGESEYSPHPVQFTTPAEAEEPEEQTPTIHWWFAFLVARLEHGPYDWTSLIFDECADLAPDSARADKSQTYEKVLSLRRVMADSRKYFLSLFFFGHHEENLHSKIRRTVQWRVNMPDGTANPCQSNNDRPPVGFNQLKMKYDVMSRQSVGRGLWWTETNFTRFTWSDIPKSEVDESRWLQINLKLQSTPARASDPQGRRGAGDD